MRHLAAALDEHLWKAELVAHVVLDPTQSGLGRRRAPALWAAAIHVRLGGAAGVVCSHSLDVPTIEIDLGPVEHVTPTAVQAIARRAAELCEGRALRLHD